MRHWLTPQCILVALLLVAAPGAALGHLLVTWVPAKLALAHLNRTVAQQTRQLEAICEQSTLLLAQTTRLQQIRATISDPSRAAWLPRRDRDATFDQLAEAFQIREVSLEHMTLDDPALYAAASRTNLLACERVTVACSGDFAALTGCLDRAARLELPLRFVRLAWGRGPAGLSLAVEVQIPFVPDAALGTALASAAKLEDKHER